MTKQQVLDILLEVRALIQSRNKWIQGRFAVRADGMPCSPLAKDATRFCLEGALARASGGFSTHGPYWAILAATCETSLVALNDDHTHDAVIAALDFAIAKHRIERKPCAVISLWQIHPCAARHERILGKESSGSTEKTRNSDRRFRKPKLRPINQLVRARDGVKPPSNGQ